MVSQHFKKLRVLYKLYKTKGKEIYALLDPLGQLTDVDVNDAIIIAQGLINALPKEKRDALSPLIEDAIQLRKQCLPYFKGSSKRGHETYIWLLRKVQQHLGKVPGNDAKEIGVDIEEHEPVVDVKQDLQGTDQEQSEEAGRAGDEEASHFDGITLDQIDFLSFMETLMALVEKAAADKELPIGVAASLSTILLCEADRFINQTAPLDKKDWEETRKGPTPWDRCMSYPMLAGGWVDALDQARGAGEAWRKLGALPPKFIFYLDFMRPSMQVVLKLIPRNCAPYAFSMLFRGHEALSEQNPGDFTLMSLANLPLATIISLYFFSLVFTEDIQQRELLQDAKNTVRAEMDECLDMLPRMIRDKALTDQEANTFRTTVASMKRWADACTELISLGGIHVFSRVYWTDWCRDSIAANSNLLQTFLYLCEKWRLEAAVNEGASGRNGVGDEDERLLGALLEDSRVAPFLLMNGRPRTVQECIVALQNWCHISTKDGETLSPLSGPITGLKEETERRGKVVQRSCQSRKTESQE